MVVGVDRGRGVETAGGIFDYGPLAMEALGACMWLACGRYSR